jgi:hypothetical protein
MSEGERDIPHRVAVFADACGMTARHRAELAPFAHRQGSARG